MPADERRVRVTHPYHPLFGQELHLILHTRSWWQDRVVCSDAEEHVHTLPAGWTDLRPPDPFLVVAAGRSFFRTRDLLLLVELLRNLSAATPAAAGETSPAAVSEITPGASRE